MCARVRVCVYVCLCVSVCVCMCKCVSVCAFTGTGKFPVVERKAQRYRELASACVHSQHTSIITLEVGSRSFLSIAGFQQLYQLVQAKATDRAAFERDIIRHVVSSSYDIWCKRNWYSEICA